MVLFRVKPAVSPTRCVFGSLEEFASHFTLNHNQFNECKLLNVAGYFSCVVLENRATSEITISSLLS